MERSTIFDDVLRTIQERLPQLLIPLVNEVFGTSYTMDTEVTRLPEEYQKVISKVIADSCNKVDKLVYHIECQSTKDGNMVLCHLFAFDKKYFERGSVRDYTWKRASSYIRGANIAIKRLQY